MVNDQPHLAPFMHVSFKWTVILLGISKEWGGGGGGEGIPNEFID